MLARVFVFATCLACVYAHVVRLTCIGDSITEGGGCHAYSYVDLLGEMLGSGFKVWNAGKSAQTQLKKGLCNGSGTCSYWDTDAWQSALDTKADIVTIMLGTNDAKVFNWEGIRSESLLSCIHLYIS